MGKYRYYSINNNNNELIYNIKFECDKVKLEIQSNYNHGGKYIGDSNYKYKSGLDYKYSYKNDMIHIECNYDLKKIMTILNEFDFIIQTDIVNIYINTNNKENSPIINKILELDWFRFISFETNCEDIFDLRNLKNIKYVHFNNDFLTYSEQLNLFPQNDINLTLLINYKRNILIKIPKNIIKIDLIRINLPGTCIVDFSPYKLDLHINDEFQMYIVVDKTTPDYLLNSNSNQIDFVVILDHNLSLDTLPNTIQKIHLENSSNLDYLPESLEYLSLTENFDQINFSNIPIGIKKIKIYLKEIKFLFSSIPDSVEIIEMVYNKDYLKKNLSELINIDKLSKNLKKIILYAKNKFILPAEHLKYCKILDKLNLIKEETNSDFKIESKNNYLS